MVTSVLPLFRSPFSQHRKGEGSVAWSPHNLTWQRADLPVAAHELLAQLRRVVHVDHGLNLRPTMLHVLHRFSHCEIVGSTCVCDVRTSVPNS